MLGSNIKYYRLKNNLTLRELANRINVTAMALSNYENNKRRPNNSIITKIVKELNIDLNDLLTTYDTTSTNIIYEDYSYNFLNKLEKEYIDVQINDYVSRYMQILNFANINTELLKSKKENVLEIENDSTINSYNLRKYLDISSSGPINIVEALEKNNIITIPIKFNSNFILTTGTINNSTRFLAYNSILNERIIKHIVYLLIEIFFKSINSFSKALIKNTYLEFLLPKKDLNIFLKNNKRYTSFLNMNQIKYHIQLNDYLYYLKKEKIFNGKYEKNIIPSNYQNNRFNYLLEQLYENKYIDERKYKELKKDNMLK